MSEQKFNPPKFEVGQSSVKFIKDPDALSGKIVSFTYDSVNGYVYKVTSRYFDAGKNSMVEGFKILNEKEVVAVKTK